MGVFYVVATPIGNLGDISARAIATLKEVDLIISEDTRETSKILTKEGIETPQISYRDQNHEKVVDHIISLLAEGGSIALTCDSGTPTISDPGFKLIRELVKQEVSLITIPGPSALVAALSVSGLPTDNFSFLGFLPRKTSQRKELLVKFGDLPSTLIIYESPYRVAKLLDEIKENLGNRVVCLAKDLTKKHEKVITKQVDELLEQVESLKLKGEYVVLIAKKDYALN